ncbi:virion structural protein [Vibrio phage K406]
MATHTTAIRNSIADHVVDLIDGGTGNATGQLIFRTSGSAEVATLNMSNPAFGSATGGVATAAAITDDTNATGGTVATCELVNRDGDVIVQGTVGTTGTDIIVSSTTIPVGATITVTNLTYTAPN